MKNVPRKHHYVPQFYLAGFTLDGSSESPLFVCDQEQSKTWKSTPKQSAHRRDFLVRNLPQPQNTRQWSR